MSGTFPTVGSCAYPPVFAATITNWAMVEYFICIGAILLITAIAALWYASRRQPLQRTERHGRHRHSIIGSSGRKRRRREHRKRNPTLAETGGLPPIRGETSSSEERPQS